MTIPTWGPVDPMTDIYRRVRNLERQVQQQGASRTLENATIDQGGISLVNGGTVRVVDSAGVEIARLGALPGLYDRADGSPQSGVLLQREDASAALLLGDANAGTPPFKQSLQVFDRAGSVVLADDATGGVGLARPHIPLNPLTTTTVATWPATSAATWTTIADAYTERQNPRVSWIIELNADAGVTAQFQLLYGGTPIGSVQTITGPGFTVWSDTQPISASVPFGAVSLLALQAQITGGTGSARAVQLSLAGSQS